MQFILEFEFES